MIYLSQLCPRAFRMNDKFLIMQTVRLLLRQRKSVWYLSNFPVHVIDISLIKFGILEQQLTWSPCLSGVSHFSDHGMPADEYIFQSVFRFYLKFLATTARTEIKCMPSYSKTRVTASMSTNSSLNKETEIIHRHHKMSR